MSAMLFALIFPRAQRAGTFDNSAEGNVWLQSALRSLRLYGNSSLCDRLRSAIVCDHMETSLITDLFKAEAMQCAAVNKT